MNKEELIMKDEILKISKITKQEFKNGSLSFRNVSRAYVYNLYSTIEFSNGLKLKAYRCFDISKEKISVGDEVRVLYRLNKYKNKWNDGDVDKIYDKDFKFTSEIVGLDIIDEERYILDKIPFDKEVGCFKTDLKSHNYYGSYYTDSKYLIWLYNKNIDGNKDELKQTIASVIINELVLDSSNYNGSVYEGVAISKILDIANNILKENNILNVDIEKAYDDVKRLFFKGRNEGTIFHNKFTD